MLTLDQLATLPSGIQLLVCWPGDTCARAFTLVHLGHAGHPALVTDFELRHSLPPTARPLADTVNVRAAEGPARCCPHI